LPETAESNKFVIKDGLKVPTMKHLFIAGGDPYKYNITKGKKSEISDGAGSVFRKFNPAIDHPDMSPEKWQTDDFCCTYSNRPADKKIYGEDMIMMCVYFGCEMFPEINVDFLWDYFEERGYKGYLYYQLDRKTRKRSKTPGATTNVNMQESIFAEMGSWIERRGKYTKHDEVIYQCREIVDDMNPFDLFVASGYALVGNKKPELAAQPMMRIVSPVRKFQYQITR
jgi:hypothetical protein